MNEPSIQNVPDTAFMAAAYRASESDRADALFQDPLAAVLAGQRGRDIIARLPPKAMMGGWSVIIRTCIIDELIQQAVDNGIDTILNLGAGLDTRPYRMHLPTQLRWIEVDHARIIEWKEPRLAQETPRCQLRRIKLDLADTAERQQMLNAVAADSKRILVLMEAVTPYLPENEVAALARELYEHQSVHYWLVDYFSPDAYEYRRRSGMSNALKNAPFLFEPQDYFSFFASTGWQPDQLRFFAEEAKRLNRPAPFPWHMCLFTAAIGMFMPPDKRKAMQRYAGFVLFAPDRS